VEYKFVDHGMKKKRCNAFYVCVERSLEVTKEVCDQILELVKAKVEPFIGDFKLVCDHHEAKVHNVMVGGRMVQMKVCKKFCFVLAKGVAPCNKADYLTYTHEEGTHDAFKFNGKALEPKVMKSIASMAPAGSLDYSAPSLTSTIPPGEMFGGDYDAVNRDKYLKYKEKYLKLKQGR